MEEKYFANAVEAQRLAEAMPREADRRFWENVARAWTGLVMCVPKKQASAWFGVSNASRTSEFKLPHDE